MANVTHAADATGPLAGLSLARWPKPEGTQPARRVVNLAVRIGFDYRRRQRRAETPAAIVPDAARTRWQQVMTDRFFMVPGISRDVRRPLQSRACPTCIGVASNRRDFGARFSL